MKHSPVGVKGANENYNGLVRQYFPKKSSFESIITKEINCVEKLLNNRTRKSCGYISTIQKINSLTEVAFVT